MTTTVLSLIITTLLWRWYSSEPQPLVAALAGCAALVAMVNTWRARRHGRLTHLPAMIAGGGAVVCLVGLIDSLWPCPTSCQAGVAYGELLGLPSALWGALALSSYGVVVGSGRGRGLWAPLAWGLAGISVYYLLLSVMLAMLCPHCLATHSWVLTLAACWAGPRLTTSLGTWVSPGSWTLRLMTAALAGLAVHACYHPPQPAATPIVISDRQLSAAEVHLLTSADRARYHGSPSAPLRLTVAVDPDCEHCRRLLPPLRQALEPALTNGRIELVYRLRSGRGANATNHARYAVVGWLSGHFAAVMADPDGAAVTYPHLDDIAATHRAAIDHLRALDDHLLRQRDLHRGASPAVVIDDRAGAELQRWQGAVTVDDILEAFARHAP
ncbi:MAG: hypothetical protein ACYTF0_03595 [Planctomycetota bacterium]|jgi:hypothetical protein